MWWKYPGISDQGCTTLLFYQNHWIIQFNSVNIMVYEIYLHKNILKKILNKTLTSQNSAVHFKKHVSRPISFTVGIKNDSLFGNLLK